MMSGEGAKESVRVFLMSLAPDPCSGGVALATDAQPCSPSAGRWVLAASVLGSSMAFIDGTVVSVALPVLQQDLGVGVSGAQWIVEAYALFLSSLVLVGGSLADRFGRKRLFSIGAASFAVASLGCGLAPGAIALIAARAVQGIGAALLVPSSLAMLGAAFPPQERGRAVGMWSALTSIASAVGPALGGWLVEAISWRAVFLINLPIAGAVLWIAQRHIAETRNPRGGRLDLPGAILATLGLGGLVFGLIEAAAVGWANPRAWGAAAAGCAGLAAFVAVERQSAHPMVSLNLFGRRTFATANLLTLFLYAALAATFFFLPFVLIQARGYRPSAAGAAILPLVVIVSALSRSSGALADRFGARLPLTVGPLVAAAGFLLFAILPASGGFAATLLPALCTLGLGMAITIAPLTATVLGAVDRADQGTASGINNAVARVAALLAVAVFGLIAAGTFNRELDRRLADAHVSAEVVRLLAPDRIRLGALQPPSSASAEEAGAIRAAVKAGLDRSFRVTSLACAGLALAAAACGALSAATKRRARRQPKG
jgi:EmrB/QacA subfamily drug resistance transporter